MLGLWLTGASTRCYGDSLFHICHIVLARVMSMSIKQLQQSFGILEVSSYKITIGQITSLTREWNIGDPSV